ncbi:MAG: 3-phosphoserine/phosphohydroxythreonine transaminase [Bacteroidota bacterium]|nr:3-phosphoserine/phosphohydroxythreonine transaminase [Bacteroidota bacterium]
MSKIHNFSAGPSILPKEAIQACVEGIQNFAGTGLSLLEVSHRGKEFVKVVEDTQAIIKELMDIPEGYEILFLGGGASMQFITVAYNLLENKGAYLKTGVWAANAAKEAKHFGTVEIIASSEDRNYCYIPKNYTIPTDADYFHCTSNNTIYGSQMQSFPDSPVTMVCDMSSDILSRKVDVSKFGLIYAGAQKNMGPAGVTVVIVRKDILGKVSRQIPSMMDYAVHIKSESMFNTPPVFPIYAMLQNLKWVKQQGGVEGMQKRAKARAELLYSEIDNNPLFKGTVDKEDRSQMNVCFLLTDDSLTDKFNAAWKAAGISGIVGHRSVGGYRASMYNALPLESVEALVNVMKTFNS